VFRYTLLFPVQQKCFACDFQGKSQVSFLYRVLALISFLSAVWMWTWIDFHRLNFAGSGMRGKMAVMFFLMLGIFLKLFFSARAHRCAQCGSEFKKI